MFDPTCDHCGTNPEESEWCGNCGNCLPHCDNQEGCGNYTAGWNIPGYLPETDPESFPTFDEAARYLMDTIESFFDSDAQNTDIPYPTIEGQWRSLRISIRNAIEAPRDGNWYGYTSDQSLAFWITKNN